MERIGEIAAILAALSWTVNSLVIERLGRGFSAWALNILTKTGGLIAVSLLSLLLRGSLLPGADLRQWGLLLLSGFVGFSIGDGFLYAAFQRLGAKRTMLIFSANPVFAAVLGWLILGEALGLKHAAGILTAVSGIMIVILSDTPAKGEKADARGILFAALATLGQAVGVLLSKAGMQGLDAVPAAQIRLVGGTLGMAVLVSLARQWKSIPLVLHAPSGRKVITTSVLLGTLIGMVLSMLAIKFTRVAVASILTSLMPVMILPVSAVFLKEKITLREIVGAVTAVLGVSILFL